MNKKILTLAVAATLAAPTAVLAEATLYGKLHMSLDYADVQNAIAPEADLAGYYLYNGAIYPVVRVDENGNPIIGTPGQDFKGWGVSGDGSYMPGEGRANRIGVKGSEDLGGGLKAIYQVELGLNLSAADDDIVSGNNGISFRNSFVGLAGEFGTFLIGRHDTPLKISTGKLDMFADTMADYNGTVGFHDVRADNVAAYISPSFSGFQFAGAVIAPGGALAVDGDFATTETDSLAEAWSVAAIYKNGPFYAGAAYELLGSDLFMDQGTVDIGDCAVDAPTCGYVKDDYTKWRVGLGLLDWNGFSLTAIYEDQNDLPGGQVRDAYGTIDPDGNITLGSISGVKEQQLWQVQAGYAFGNNTIKAMYGSVDRGDAEVLSATRDTLSINNLKSDLEGDRSTWAVGFDHNFSKRTTAYALYTSVDDDNNGLVGISGAEWSGFSLGMIHKF